MMDTEAGNEKVSRTSDKHTRIINAALKVFAEKGFYNTRISEIAREADVADGTIYLYFKNKDDILISLFEEEIGKICKIMQEELSKTEDPMEKLRIFASRHLNLILKNRNLAEVLQVELRQSAKFMRKYVNKTFMDYINLARAIIIEGQNRGIFRKDLTPGIIKRAFFGALDEMASYWVLSSTKRHTPLESSLQISEIFIKGLLVEPKQDDGVGK
jgi:TetR/AcrR family transcriptional regulator, fatty acid metabolism regulator protein